MAVPPIVGAPPALTAVASKTIEKINTVASAAGV